MTVRRYYGSTLGDRNSLKEGESGNPGEVRVMALLEAISITGSAKGVLEFAREVVRRPGESPRIVLSLATFRRGALREEPVLRDAIGELGIGWEAVEEKRRFDHGAIRQLREMAARWKPDVIWTNSVKSHFLVRWGGLQKGRGWLAFHHGYTATNTKMLLYNQLDRWSLRAADRILTVCRPFARQLCAMGVGEERITVQHMPIRETPAASEAARQEARRLIPAGAGKRIILTVGRLSKEKGQADLLQAYARLCQRAAGEFHLLMVGEGPERGELERLRERLGLCGAVTLAGQQNDVRRFYDIADVFVLSSHSEGSPNALLEAMAANVPVVATRVGGIPEMAKDGEDALLVDRSDHTAMAEAIWRIHSEEGLRERLTAAAGGVLQRHTTEAYFRAISAVLEDTWRVGQEKAKSRGWR